MFKKKQKIRQSMQFPVKRRTEDKNKNSTMLKQNTKLGQRTKLPLNVLSENKQKQKQYFQLKKDPNTKIQTIIF